MTSGKRIAAVIMSQINFNVGFIVIKFLKMSGPILELTELKRESEHQLTVWYHSFSAAPNTVDALE